MRGGGIDVPVVAGRQGGVFTGVQASAEGWTRDQIRYRVRRGSWVRVTGQVLAAAGPPIETTGWAWAACLVWKEAVVSHATAATIHGFPLDPGDGAHVIVRAPFRSIRGVRTHGLRLAEREIEEHGGLPVTTASRTALDCLAWLPPSAAFNLWAWVSTRGVVDRAGLAEGVRARFGWFGTPQLADLLMKVSGGAASPTERVLHETLAEARIRGWTASARITDLPGPPVVVDVLFAPERIVIEVDGWSSHSSRRSFVEDRRRQNRLTAAGYLVLRFTSDDLLQPTVVVRTVRRSLEIRRG